MPDFQLGFLAHGGDYNPDQWLDCPDILKEDLRLMRLAHCNIMSVGIFAWAALEPREGVFAFDWLKKVLDDLFENGVSVFLATPSGARPAWMSRKYPEVLRVENDRRNHHGNRHNHCFTSPAYRGFVTRMNTRLAEEFGRHPAVKGWHVSNEYGGCCYCEACQQAFRQWLKKRYGTLDALNRAWWTSFWSKTYTDWEEIRSPEDNGETCLQGLSLDWMRFVTDQTVDFVACETAPIRRITPDLPVTINMMDVFTGLDYTRFDGVIDFASFDSYPRWGETADQEIALRAAFSFDQIRGFKHGKPWLLMESTPSQVNWHAVCRLKKPGMQLLSGIQAVAHGSDGVMYFQWRQSLGASEKFHGAVVSHAGHEHTRVFQEVRDTGALLNALAPVAGSVVNADAAVIYDLQNRWALDGAQGPRADKQYLEVVLEHYSAIKQLGVNVDVITSDQSFDGYKIVAAPYLYMVRPGVAERLEAFVKGGGTLILTFMSGITDESDLCFTGGFPGPLRALAGVWAEEIDALYDCQKNSLVPAQGNVLGISGEYETGFLCEVIHAETACVEAVYGSDFYAGEPVLTRNAFGDGETWYMASRAARAFLDEFYQRIAERAGIARIADGLPHGVLATQRVGADGAYAFIMNFTGHEIEAELPEGVNMVTGQNVNGRHMLKPNEVAVIRRRLHEHKGE